jgi:hypothetical protein
MLCGNERSLAMEHRWAKLFIKVLQSVGIDKLSKLASGLVQRQTLAELSLHPHASLVLQALLRQLALFLAIPVNQGDSIGRQSLRSLLRLLYNAATGNSCNRINSGRMTPALLHTLSSVVSRDDSSMHVT